MSAKYNAVVTNNITITPDLFLLSVKPDNGVPDFTAGQYVALGLEQQQSQGEKPPKLIKRAYSIGSAPSQREELQFYIAVVQDGTLTPSLSRLQPGERLFCAKKITGHFTLDAVPEEGNLLLVSTGTGLAPYISMLREPSTWAHGRRITIVHGVRYHSDFGYRGELEQLQNEREGFFRYFPVCSREEALAPVTKGYVQDLFKANIIQTDPTLDHVFLCGNPAMIEELCGFLKEKGFTEHSKKQPGNIHFEKYW